MSTALPSPAAPAPLSAATHRTVVLLSFATFTSMAAQRVCDAMLPQLAREFSASLAEAAQVVSLFAVMYGLAQMFYGPLGDRLGKFRVITFTSLGCAIGSLAAVFAGDLQWLVAARVLAACFAAAVIPLSLAWIGDAVPYQQRQEILARVGVGTTLGIVGGQLIGGVMTDFLGWRWAFGLMTLLHATAGALLLGDWLRQKALPLTITSANGEAPQIMAQLKILAQNPWVRMLLAVAVAEGGAGFGVVAVAASHLHDELHLSLSLAGAVVGLFGLGGMLYMATAKHLIRRLGEPGLARIGGLGVCTAFVVLGLSPWWHSAPPACLLAGFFFFMLHNTMQANATQMAPAARGLGVSLFASSLFTGQAIGVLLASNLIPLVGSGRVIAGGGGLIAAVSLYLAHRLARRQAAIQAV